MEIGGRLKSLRQQMGLTQKELADRAELSKGFISQIENDTACPSLPTLADILECLGTDLSGFFSGTEDRRVVFDPADMYEKNDQHSRTRWLVPNAQKNRMEPIHFILSPGGRSRLDAPHDGEEFGYLISGSIILSLGDSQNPVAQGGAFYFRPDYPHYIENTGEDPAELVWVTIPPNF